MQRRCEKPGNATKHKNQGHPPAGPLFTSESSAHLGAQAGGMFLRRKRSKPSACSVHAGSHTPGRRQAHSSALALTRPPPRGSLTWAPALAPDPHLSPLATPASPLPSHSLFPPHRPASRHPSSPSSPVPGLCCTWVPRLGRWAPARNERPAFTLDPKLLSEHSKTLVKDHI